MWKWNSELDWITCCNLWTNESIKCKNSLLSFQLKNVDNQNDVNINVILQNLLIYIETNALVMANFAHYFCDKTMQMLEISEAYDQLKIVCCRYFLYFFYVKDFIFVTLLSFQNEMKRSANDLIFVSYIIM